MRQTISRLYASRAQALAAEQELRTNRLDRFDDVHVTSRDDGATTDAIVAALMKALVLKSDARIYARGIEAGGTLVTVHAPFGTARAAADILDSFEPIDSGIAAASSAPPAWDEATPVSNVLGIPALLDDGDTFSRFWNVPALTRTPRTFSAAFGIAELSRSTDAFTGTFGVSLLSDKPTILSSMFGLPLLTRRRGG